MNQQNEFWLFKQLNGFKLFKFLAVLMISYILYLILVILIMRYFGLIPCVKTDSDRMGVILFLELPLVAIAEEMMFRVFPLVCALAYSRNPMFVLHIMAFTSIAFGLMHGYFISIFIQGVAGFLYSIIFLKSGGAVSKWKTGFFVCSITHTIFNYGIFALFSFQRSPF